MNRLCFWTVLLLLVGFAQEPANQDTITLSDGRMTGRLLFDSMHVGEAENTAPGNPMTLPK